MSQTPTVATPGWYADPWHRYQWRWWDGHAWTSHVAVGGWSGTDGPDASAVPGAQPPARPTTEPPELRTFPLRSGWLALAGVAGGTALSIVVGLAAWLTTHSPTATDIVGQAGLWAGLVGAMVSVSRRYGTGKVRDDFYLRARPVDAALGLGWAFIGRLAAGAAAALVIAFNHRFSGVNGEELRNARHNVAEMLALFVIAVIGAPIIEEMFFRGLLLNAFRSRFSGTASVALQGVCFGLVHLSPFRGMGNVAVFASLTAFGMVQGAVMLRYRRLGPGIAAHFWSNLVATIANFVG